MESNELAQLNQMTQQLQDYKKQLIEKDEKYALLQAKYNSLIQQSSYHSTMGSLAAGIAHEIRNPLTTVRGFLQLLKPHLRDLNKDEYADIAIGEIDRANNILFQYLNALRPQKSEPKKVYINILIREIGLLFEGEANLHNITLQTTLTTENPSIYIDEFQLKQVLVNMMRNALEAISFSNRPQGTICLYTEKVGDKIMIGIKDNGCGMSTQSIKTIFTPFYSTKATGTGLGLTISRKIIQAFGGDIDINSCLDEGTTFIIQFPFSEEVMIHA